MRGGWYKNIDMKYTGILTGFKSSYGSIYNIINDDTRCYAWKANVVAELNDKMLKISFNWNGDTFDLSLTLLKENYYTGKIFLAGENFGQIYLWQYIKDKEIILKGDWIEDVAGNYDCFIELKPFKSF